MTFSRVFPWVVFFILLVFPSVYLFERTTGMLPSLGLESLSPLITSLMLDGLNPYGMERLPEYCNIYGVVDKLIAYPVAAQYGSSLQLHRMIAVVCVFLTIILFFFTLLRLGCSSLYAALISGVWWVQLVSTSTVWARGDAVGLLFYVSAIVIPIWMKRSNYSFAIAIALAITGFFAKQYFLIAGILICFARSFGRPITQGIMYFGIFITAFVIVLVAMNVIFPMYITNSIIIHMALQVLYFNPKMAVFETGLYLYENAFLIIFAALLISSKTLGVSGALATLYSSLRVSWKMRSLAAWGHLIGAKLKQDYLLGISLAITPFAFYIMTNGGNSFSYPVQLLSPPLLLLLGRSIGTRIETRYTIPLFAALIWAVVGLPRYSAEHDKVTGTWWEERLESSSHIYSHEDFSLILQDQGKKVENTGFTHWCGTALTPLTWLNDELQQAHSNWESEKRRKLREQWYELIIDTNEQSPAGYRLTGTHDCPQSNYLAPERWIKLKSPEPRVRMCYIHEPNR